MAKVTIAVDLDKKALRDGYIQAITDLTTIKNYTNPTNAQVIAAVKKEAEILEKLLKVIKNMVT
jgi:hypothetical protein